MSDEQLRRLRRVLASVAGEQWSGRPGGCQVTVEAGIPVVVAETFSPDRAAFIRTFDPATVAELLALAEKALA
jgi:hypothetical protein